jgi:uncharacterized protein
MSASPTSGRLLELDVLRGAALLGICIVNIAFHALPAEVAMAIPAPEQPSELATWAITRALFEAKFFSIFSLLFGMSLALQVRARAERGEKSGTVIARRQLFLCAAGITHGVVLFAGDVLLPYAILGLVAFASLYLRPRFAIVAAAGLFVVAALLSCAGAIIGGPEMRAVELPEPLTGPITLERLLPEDEHSLSAIELRVFREGPVWAAFVVRGAEYALWMFTSTFLSGFNARVLALMLLGGALLRSDVFAERWRTLRRRVCVASWIVGLALELANTLLLAIEPERGVAARLALTIAHELGSLALAAAIALTLVAWAQSGRAHTLALWIASAGRMAFSNYLGQSLVANLLFSGLGFGLYGRCSRTELAAIAVALWCVQVAASHAWLARFELGPLEWIWRAFTHWRWPRFVRARTGTDPA